MCSHPLGSLILATGILALCSLSPAAAHGGGLHRWTLDASVLDVVPNAALRTEYAPWIVAASASEWNVLDTTDAAIKSNYFLPSLDPPNNNVTVKGKVDVYVYIRNNCTTGGQTTLVANLMYTKYEMTGGKWEKVDGKWQKTGGKWQTNPYGRVKKHVQTYAYGFTGTCDSPGNIYRNDATDPMMLDNRFNMEYWNKENLIGVGMNESDTVTGGGGVPGYQWGSAPQAHIVRGPEQAAEGETLKSIVLVVQGGATFCANLKWLADPMDVMAWGVDCEAIAAAAAVNDTAAAAVDPHAGHGM
ncbi:hypothetical protein FOA52_001719 [Chlamydomonas sp. UWO 241]|nr:hypothetical protein FOA52_001719 [Chlamydomonas sp. UWO 241]